MENSTSDKAVLTLQALPSHTQRQTHSHTHYIHISLILQEAFALFCAITGTVSMNTPQEFALGSPASPGPAQLKLDGGTCPQLVLFPINQTPMSLH